LIDFAGNLLITQISVFSLAACVCLPVSFWQITEAEVFGDFGGKQLHCRAGELPRGCNGEAFQQRRLREYVAARVLFYWHYSSHSYIAVVQLSINTALLAAWYECNSAHVKYYFCNFYCNLASLQMFMKRSPYWIQS